MIASQSTISWATRQSSARASVASALCAGTTTETKGLRATPSYPRPVRRENKGPKTSPAISGQRRRSCRRMLASVAPMVCSASNIGTTPPRVASSWIIELSFSSARVGECQKTDDGIGWQHCSVKIGANWRQAKRLEDRLNGKRSSPRSTAWDSGAGRSAPSSMDARFMERPEAWAEVGMPCPARQSSSQR